MQGGVGRNLLKRSNDGQSERKNASKLCGWYLKIPHWSSGNVFCLLKILEKPKWDSRIKGAISINKASFKNKGNRKVGNKDWVEVYIISKRSIV